VNPYADSDHKEFANFIKYKVLGKETFTGIKCAWIRTEKIKQGKTIFNSRLVAQSFKDGRTEINTYVHKLTNEFPTQSNTYTVKPQ
jgi:hypothetical protein